MRDRTCFAEISSPIKKRQRDNSQKQQANFPIATCQIDSALKPTLARLCGQTLKAVLADRVLTTSPHVILEDGEGNFAGRRNIFS